MKIRLAMAAAMLLMLSACTSSEPLVIDAPATELAPPPPDKAQIVFVEPVNAVGGAFATGIYEINGDERNLLTMLNAHSKNVQLVTPGHHFYMANTVYVSHFMNANVEAGKRYYVLLRFVYGHGLQLRPLRPSGPSDYSVQNRDFPDWLAKTQFTEKSAAGDAWYAKYKDVVDKAQAAAWTDWQAKSDEQRAELTLNPDDAIAQ